MLLRILFLCYLFGCSEYNYNDKVSDVDPNHDSDSFEQQDTAIDSPDENGELSSELLEPSVSLLMKIHQIQPLMMGLIQRLTIQQWLFLTAMSSPS